MPSGTGCAQHQLSRPCQLLIETRGGVRAVTDYNDIDVPVEPPDIGTMNQLVLPMH